MLARRRRNRRKAETRLATESGATMATAREEQLERENEALTKCVRDHERERDVFIARLRAYDSAGGRINGDAAVEGVAAASPGSKRCSSARAWHGGT